MSAVGACSGRATLLVTVIVAGVAAFAGCGSTVVAGPATSPAPGSVVPSPRAPSRTPTVAPDPRTVPPVHWKAEPAHWMGPSDPQVGVSYPFDLLTHCGIGTTRFGGRYWLATTPRPAPGRRPGAGGSYNYDGYTTGMMTLLSDDRLRFVITDPRVAGDGGSVDFTPLPATAASPLPCA